MPVVLLKLARRTDVVMNSQDARSTCNSNSVFVRGTSSPLNEGLLPERNASGWLII